MWLTDNFKIEEFMSPDSDLLPIEVINNLADLADNLQILREELGEPIIINSGYRTLEHNKEVGGVLNSQHLTGKAADIRAKTHTPFEIRNKIEYLIEIGAMDQGGLGLYDTFVHYDIRGVESRWDYRKNIEK